MRSKEHKEQEFDFDALVAAICAAHEQMATQAAKAVNVALTLRNWAIGCYIREYELHGADRATYGERVLARLAGELQNSVDRCYTGRYLRLCRQFYETYPQIGKSVISALPALPANISAAKAKYALAGIANQLFVSRYQLQLPRREEIEAFVKKQVHEITGHIVLPALQVRGIAKVIRKNDKTQQ